MALIACCLLPLTALAPPRLFALRDDDATRDRLRRQVELVMAMREDEVRAMVPTSSGGIFYTDCPNCEYGSQEMYLFSKTWDPRQPDRLVCTGCGAVYPGNPKFPDNQVLDVSAMHGVTHHFPYWERDDGYRIFFQAHADYLARGWLEDRCRDLGDLYALTGDEAYARRCGVILDQFAQNYPNWCTKYDYPWQQVRFASPPADRIEGIRGYRNSRWTWWAYMDIPLELLQAWEGVRDWPGLSADVKKRIEGDLLLALPEFVLGIDEEYSNMSMGMWRSAILAGRLLSRPDWIHDAVRRFEHLLDTQFLYDGHWLETADSYAAQTNGGLQVVMQAAAGYTDPAGYHDAVDGRRFEDLDLRQAAPGFAAQAWVVGAARFPDNRLLPVNDTWATPKITSRWWGAPTRDAIEPVLLPGSGVAVLGGGEGDQQFHGYLNHTMGRHHKHYDALSIGLYANGRELVPDIGYTHTNYRTHWATTTMAHNTVVVDGRNRRYDVDHTGHRLREFAVVDGFQITAVDANSAYPDRTQRYRRTLAMLGHDATDAYLLDVFEVAGGQQHDWLMLGCLDEDMSAQVDGATLKPFAGTLLNNGVAFAKPRDSAVPNPDGYGFGFWSNLQAGAVAGETVILATHPKAAPSHGLRTILSPGPGSTVYLGDVPSIRRADEQNSALDQYQAPAFCIRRQGNELQSRFVAVHEPLAGEPRVHGLRTEVQDDVMLVEVTHADGVDLYVQALNDDAAATFATPAGELRFEGNYGLVRRRDGRSVAAHLIGRRLTIGEVDLSAQAWAGTVTATSREDGEGSRGWIQVAERIETDRHGALILEFPDGTMRAFNAVEREPVDGGTRLRVREDTGFEVEADRVRLVSYPQREIAGTGLRYRLAEMASWPR